ncbi:MAG: shikimate kinase [Bryobacterales bacterium]|nr:shikimate kinase [Bryobacterales bacterium]
MHKTIYLVGFMGSGKSTIGRCLAERLGLPFADLDDDIEAAAGRPIADIFANDGEAAFRDAEHAALVARVQSLAPAVVALGGGAYTFARNREVLRGAGTSVWLDCPFERALARVAGFDHRPLAKDPAQFRQLFERRTADYALADVRIPVTSDDPEEAARAIVEVLG